MAVTITVKGLDELKAKFRKIIPALQDYNRAWPSIRQTFIEITEERFNRRGPGWAPLSPAYAAWKARHYPGQPLLVRTGRMRQQVTSGLTMRATARTINFTTANTYWFYHQFGTRRMPARPIVNLGPVEQQKLTDSVERYIRDELRSAGLV